MATDDKPTPDDPTGGHDPKALEDAAKKFNVDPNAHKEPGDDGDPAGGHDPEALDDAAKKMGVE